MERKRGLLSFDFLFLPPGALFSNIYFIIFLKVISLMTLTSQGHDGPSGDQQFLTVSTLHVSHVGGFFAGHD